jgi:hypothetical protein
MYLDGLLGYDEAMIASDSPTNLAWLINQSNPNSRVDAMERSGDDGKPRRSPSADFTALSIDAELLDR